MRAAAVALLPLALLGAAPMRCGDDPTPRLEAQRRELLARTVPKAEFWDAVGRKGERVKQQKAIEARLGPIDEKRAAVEAEIAAAASDLAAARVAREEAQSALAAARAELARAHGEQEAREAKIRGIAERHAEGGSS